MERTLKDIFIVPPISVLDVKQKYWKDRRNVWLSSGIRSELGRDKNLLSLSPLLQKKQKSTSIFDPVLCEIMYNWFTKENDLVFDRFCGGSVRGIVASFLNRNYVGVDIRQEQLEENKKQTELCNTHIPRYYHTSEITNERYDFFFTCPPYWNLEKYSNQSDDLSNMDQDIFWTEYRSILENSLVNLSDDRFAAIVVGDVRDSSGNYIRLPQKTVDIFIDCGLHLYNEMVLLQEPVSAAMRAFNYMNSSRKIAKSHQNVLIFVKGNAKLATERLPSFSDTQTEDSSSHKFFKL